LHNICIRRRQRKKRIDSKKQNESWEDENSGERLQRSKTVTGARGNIMIINMKIASASEIYQRPYLINIISRCQ
jgi:hypothetical protein